MAPVALMESSKSLTLLLDRTEVGRVSRGMTAEPRTYVPDARDLFAPWVRGIAVLACQKTGEGIPLPLRCAFAFEDK